MTCAAFKPPPTHTHTLPLIHIHHLHLQTLSISTHRTLAAGAAALPWALQSDGSIAFNVDCPVQGDVLLRVRHLAAGGQKVGEGGSTPLVVWIVFFSMW